MKICVSNKFLDDADSAGPGTTLGESLHCIFIKSPTRLSRVEAVGAQVRIGAGGTPCPSTVN